MGNVRVEGPVPGPFVLWTTSFDLESQGYVGEEYFLFGTARSYRHLTEPADDGEWLVEPADSTNYVTRLVLYRPLDMASFSGSVHVEWLNVSGGLDAAPGWLYAHRHLMRTGDAWAGVSAQKVGIDGVGLDLGMHLKAVDPERYRRLAHPGDAYAYDIFTQAIVAVRDQLGLAGGTGSVLAMGSSQSAMALVTYLNAIDPHDKVIDGCLVHGRGAEAMPLDGGFVPWQYGEHRIGRHRVRSDVRVPVLTVQSETDVVLLGGGRARQPDTETFRLWEVAGAAHFDTYGLQVALRDNGDIPLAELSDPATPGDGAGGVGPTYNSSWQMHYVLQSALAHLGRWSRGVEPAPPAAGRLLSPDAEASSLLLSALGLVRGGVRTPWVDAPVAVHSGLREADSEGAHIDLLFGATTVFEAGVLEGLYPGGRTEYMERFATALDRSVLSGFILADDEDEIMAGGEHEWPFRN